MINLHRIETLVPPACFKQETFAQIQINLVKNPKMRRLVQGLYQDCGVETRHSVVVEPTDPFKSSFFSFLNNNDSSPEPSTQERNDFYAQSCTPLGVEVTRRVLEGSSFKSGEITHIITASCTGFYNPGVDLKIIQQLGLPLSTQRFHLGFMGCQAALPALRMAEQFCRASPEAVVLVVCIELCTLHFHRAGDLDTLLANSLFADGVAAAIVSAKPPQPQTPHFQMRAFSSTLILEGMGDMAWNIGDHGFDLVLSRYVPKIIGTRIGKAVDQFLHQWGLTPEEIGEWAVHPGGKSILDKFQKSMNLDPALLAASRQVLREFGNMSSATILFVLKSILESSQPHTENVGAIAFGPGLTVESAWLKKEIA